ncbi:MAG: class I SAM-dependent methyltransferase [Christensenellales bacterium]
MNGIAKKNARRFSGFADTYENARPQMPLYPISVIEKYLGRTPGLVLDLGCGTGLSTLIWQGRCKKVIGIEPSEDMLAVARKKETDGVSFIKAYAHDTGLADHAADAVVCSQSFHWMEPKQTLHEINRVLFPDGIFAAVDCDWPPVCHPEAELAYHELMHKASIIEKENSTLESSFFRWDKNKHLSSIEKSGYFRYAREIVFINSEPCTANRLVNIALSQGGVQSILKLQPEALSGEINKYREKVCAVFGDRNFTIDFCYRMRISIK